MYTKLLFLLISLLGISGDSLSQSSFSGEFRFKATYQIVYLPDSTDATSSRSEEMVLYLGDGTSRFSSAERARADSILQNRRRNRSEFTGSFQGAPQTRFDYYVYKGIPKSKMSYTRKILKNNFRHVEDLDLFNWQVQSETKEIAGYQTQKATTSFAGRDYVAWFTAEIPIPDGPYKFNGLPGLILEVRDVEGHYSFSLVNFTRLEEPIVYEFNSRNYITTTRQKFEQVIEEYDRDPFAAMERHGITFGFKAGQRERIEQERKERLRRENNPIELE